MFVWFGFDMLCLLCWAIVGCGWSYAYTFRSMLVWGWLVYWLFVSVDWCVGMFMFCGLGLFWFGE